MKKIFSVDRLEGDLAVCISDDGEQLICPLSALDGMKARDIFAAETDGETLTEITPLPDERDHRLKANKERLQRLINRKNN